MRRFTLLTICLLALASFIATTALAQNTHYKKGPSCVDNGLTVTCTGTLAGLGNGSLLITIDNLQGSGPTECTNKGGNVVPGQNPANSVVAGSVAIPSNQIKNGAVSFTVTTLPPAEPTAAEAGCPNGNWSASIVSLTFTGGALDVSQLPNGCTSVSSTCQYSVVLTTSPVPF